MGELHARPACASRPDSTSHTRRQQRHTASYFASAVCRRTHINAADVEPSPYLVTKPKQQHISETGGEIHEVIEIETVGSRPGAHLTLRQHSNPTRHRSQVAVFPMRAAHLHAAATRSG
jgi:hypothetical protein